MTETSERKAEMIIGQTLDLPQDQRAAAALKACAGDADLLRRVMSLLSADGAAEGFMDATSDGPSVFGKAAPVGEKPGDTIGRYKLLEKIGEGGFGVVFTAEQQKPVRRLVAIKVIKLGMDTREVVSRFEAERQALALMDHPNIARVLDAGSTESGRPYFVMELVRGSTVTEYADKHKLSTKDRVALAAQICRAVQHAHSKGVIHRDLKPTNVLVTVTDDKAVPKVIDFGIAKATQGRLSDHTLYTAHRQLIGTPQYMSPEQADSDGSDIDTRTDVYSLGVLLYELLVGTTPFDAKQLRSAAYEAMRKMIRDTDVPRPATRLHTLADEAQSIIAASRSTDVKKLTDSVKGELDWIIMKALEKDRTRRYDTASALADDLNRYLSGDAVLAGPVSGVYRLKKTLRRYKAAAIIGGAIAACLLLGVAGTSWGLIRSRANERRAVAAEVRATDQAALAEVEKQDAIAQKRDAIAQKTEAEHQKQLALTSEQDAKAKTTEAKATLDFFTGLLAKASPNQTKDAAVSQVLVDKLIKPALATIDRQFKNQPLVRASIQYTLAATLNDLGQYKLAETQAKAAWDARRRLLGDDHPETLQALNNYAGAINAQGRHAEAERLYKQVWDAERRVQGDDHPDTLSALNNYAESINAQGRHAEAERLDKQVWDARRRVQGDDHPGTLTALANYVLAIDAQGRHAEAESLNKQLWDASRRVQGDDNPDTLKALNNYALAIEEQGRFAEAEPLLKQLSDADRRVLGADHPVTLAELYNYAIAIAGQGRYAEAEPLLRQVTDTLRPDDPIRGSVLFSFGRCLAAQHKWAEAETVLRENWALDQAHPDPTRPSVPLSLQLLNQCLRQEGKLQEGGPATQPPTLPATVSSTADADALYAAAIANANSGHRSNAIPQLKKATDYYRQSAPDYGNRGPALYCLGQFLASQHRWTQAEAVARENYQWDLAHPSPDRASRTVPGSLKLLNQILKHEGKPEESTTQPAR